MQKLSRQEVIRKCIVVFEAIRRMTSKGGASLEPEHGAEDEYDMVNDCTQQLREILKDMQAHDHDRELQKKVEEAYETRMKDWQKDAAGGPPERMVF